MTVSLSELLRGKLKRTLEETHDQEFLMESDAV